tara:strand:- start:242 stop:1798 length:1557 start_codon:yes stop_codon:yes gene_type:complete
MQVGGGGTVKIEDSIIFKRLNGSYLMSLGYFRTLVMLDQCHDFCESNNRNKWINDKKFTKDDIIDSIMKFYRDDMKFIYDSFISLEPNSADRFNTLYNSVASDPKIRTSLKSTHGIRDNILKGGINIESSIGITSANLYNYVTEFNCSSFSKYLVSILSQGKTITRGVMLGVDATKNNAGYSSIFTNICNVVSRPDVQIAVLQSPATDYDPAGTSGVTNFIINMVTKANKTPALLGQLNAFQNNNYKVRVTAKDIPFIDFTYYINKSINDKYITLYVNRFFSQTQQRGDIPKPSGITKINSKKIGSGTQNSVSYLTENFTPNDNIYLFKTIGDLGQALSYKIESQKYPDLTNFYITFDYLSALISSLFNMGTLLEDTGNAISPLSIFAFSQEQLQNISSTGANIEDIGAAQQIIGLSRKRHATFFGKKSNKLKDISDKELKTKLKSVGINISKLNSKGKRLPLTRKEMEKKAVMFKNLQIRSKKIGIKLMYKSRRKGYVYKTYTRLMNELQKTKMKFG